MDRGRAALREIKNVVSRRGALIVPAAMDQRKIVPIEIFCLHKRRGGAQPGECNADRGVPVRLPCDAGNAAPDKPVVVDHQNARPHCQAFCHESVVIVRAELCFLPGFPAVGGKIAPCTVPAPGVDEQQRPVRRNCRSILLAVRISSLPERAEIPQVLVQHLVQIRAGFLGLFQQLRDFPLALQQRGQRPEFRQACHIVQVVWLYAQHEAFTAQVHVLGYHLQRAGVEPCLVAGLVGEYGRRGVV